MKNLCGILSACVFIMSAAGCGSSSNELDGTTLVYRGTLDERTPVIAESQIPFADAAGTRNATTTTSFDDLAAVASFSTVAKVFDDQKIVRSFTTYFFHIAPFEYEARLYVSSNDVSSRTDSLPQLAEDGTGFGNIILTFDPTTGGRTNQPATTDNNTEVDLELMVPWIDSKTPQQVNIFMTGFVGAQAPSTIDNITAN